MINNIRKFFPIAFWESCPKSFIKLSSQCHWLHTLPSHIWWWRLTCLILNMISLTPDQKCSTLDQIEKKIRFQPVVLFTNRKPIIIISIEGMIKSSLWIFKNVHCSLPPLSRWISIATCVFILHVFFLMLYLKNWCEEGSATCILIEG